MRWSRRLVVLAAISVGVVLSFAIWAHFSLPPRHRYPEWRRLIVYARPIGRALLFSEGTVNTPPDWEWKRSVLQVEGDSVAKELGEMEDSGIVVDTSNEVRGADVSFAIVGERDVVLARKDGWFAVLRKDEFYGAADKARAASEATLWGRWAPSFRGHKPD